MKYKTITYQAVKNLGNYESERLEMTVELDSLEEDDPEVAAFSLRHRVNSILNSPPPGVMGKKQEAGIDDIGF